MMTCKEVENEVFRQASFFAKKHGLRTGYIGPRPGQATLISVSMLKELGEQKVSLATEVAFSREAFSGLSPTEAIAKIEIGLMCAKIRLDKARIC